MPLDIVGARLALDIIGHRGARALHPENTLPGFLAALAGGTRQFEADAGMTRNGVVVLCHDPFLPGDIARTPDGAWLGSRRVLLHGIDHDHLQEFDVGRLRPGSRVWRRFPRQRPADGARVPTLLQALRLHPAARWTIELKTFPNRPHWTAAPEALAEAVADAVDLAGAAGRVTVQSFDWRGPRHLRRRRPDLAYAWLTARSTRAWRGGQRRLPQAVAAEGGGTWSPQWRELTRARLRRAQAAGLRVAPWTVNDPAAWLRLAAWGVDGLITDDPAAARAALSPASAPSPPHPAPS